MNHLTVILCALYVLCGASGATEARQKPSIVVILADDLGYGDLSCYGSAIQTPNIDRLAREGTRFTDFHSNGAVCSPTRCALVTGRYQQRAGIGGLARGDHGMTAKPFTIANAMKSAGYATGMFGKWHLGETPEFNPVNYGFDEFIGQLGGRIDYFTHRAAGKAGPLDWWKGVEPLEEKGYSTTLIADHAIDFIKRHKYQPFFLYVPFNAPHTPIQYPGATDEKSPEAYRKVVEWMDKESGRILSALKEEGLVDNTFVFFFSDNGGHLAVQGCSNKPLRGEKGSFWEGGHREPAIARWPGHIPAGKVTNQTAMSMDLMPTAVELTGATVSHDRKLDGISLIPLLLHDEPIPARILYWAQGKDWAVRDGAWKLLKDGDSTHLFDLSKDLGEQNDLAAKFPERVKQMQEDFQAWSKDVGAGRAEGATRRGARGKAAKGQAEPASEE